MMEQLGDRCPHLAGEDGVYQDIRTDNWVSGFWAGILWLLYDRTGDEKYKGAAWRWDEEIESWMTRDHDLIHDVGFQFLNTAVMKHMMTGDPEAKRRAVSMANFLCGRFNLAGRFIRAWKWNGDEGWAIIDCTMNLSLLFWASEATGDPRYKHMARAHADTVLEHFVREDGSVRHIVQFDPETGAYDRALGGQGFGPNSSWSRGQAWGLYGLANVYRFTGDDRYLQASKRIAHYFLANLPEDGVPYWDFRLPSHEQEPRDTSAAAIAASGLLELAELVPAEEAGLYRSGAERMLRALTERYATWNRPEHEAILTGGTANKPAGWGIDVSLIYGDYFYTEAVAKLCGWARKVY
ncbi:glycoside hydrolase family 88 protein [Paenibacillus sp. CC-CFT747]|nr:glycoside hydrolase family 88 protein [Paenibacillus sp. CC-CFT747]